MTVVSKAESQDRCKFLSSFELLTLPSPLPLLAPFAFTAEAIRDTSEDPTEKAIADLKCAAIHCAASLLNDWAPNGTSYREADADLAEYIEYLDREGAHAGSTVAPDCIPAGYRLDAAALRYARACLKLANGQRRPSKLNINLGHVDQNAEVIL